MLKKNGLWIMTLILGIVLMVISFFIQDESLNSLASLCIGVGAGLLGMSLAKLYMTSYEQKNPDFVKQNEIDFKDERSVMIRHKAKTLAGDITHWAIIVLAFIFILVNAPL